MPFGEPETAGGPYPRELIGHLLLVWVVDYIADAPSKYSKAGQPSDVVVVDLVDLDDKDSFTGEPGLLARGAWWRPGGLIGSLKRRLGVQDPVLAWMTQGTGSQGFNAPFKLVSATSDPQAVARADAWLAAHPEFRPTGTSPRPQEVSGTSAQDVRPDPEPQVEVEGPSRIRSQLEQMANQSQRGADRLPPAQPEKFPY